MRIRMRTLRSAVVALAIAGVVPVAAMAPSCDGTSAASGASSTASASGSDSTGGEIPKGLDLRVADGKPGPAPLDRAKLPPASPIPDAQAAQLLSRLQPLVAEGEDQKGFALRAGVLPPPRTGETITQTFPPPPSTATPPPAAAPKLEVVRYAPEGDVPLAPSLSITFSQPMVAVTSQEEAAGQVPALLKPQPEGHWRWLGTRTLLFDPTVRFPQATTYTVEVPAGTQSATGDKLDKAVRFSFTTPTPRLVRGYPDSGPTVLEPALFALFDQKIDPAAVLATVTIEAGGKKYDARLVSDAEIAKDEAVSSLVSSAKAAEQAGRFLVFRATKAFPNDTQVTVTIGPGTPSLEGPNRTKDPQSFGFRTYPPLRIERAQCSWSNEDCRPGAPYSILFNNPLDDAKWKDALLSVKPEIPGMKIEQSFGSVVISGATKPHTAYTVTVSAKVTDRFGQTLGKEQRLEFKVGDAYPAFFGPSGLVLLDPAAKKPSLDVYTMNYAKLRVALYQVTPRDWTAWMTSLSERWHREKRPPIPGKKIFDEQVPTSGGKDELAETHVDLTPALGESGLGHVIAIVSPAPWKESYDPPTLETWVQVTRIAVDAAVDQSQMVAWTTQLADGRPAANTELELLPWGIKGTTDGRGVARLALAAAEAKGTELLIARQGDDSVFLPATDYPWGGRQWAKRPLGDELRWYVTDDRRMYRPNEEVHLKGFLRRVGMDLGGDITSAAGLVNSVAYTVQGPRGNPITKGTASVDAAGGFDFAFKLPGTPNLGWARVFLEAQGRMTGSTTHQFQIQEFRRPEFEVSTSATEGPHLIGGSADLKVEARYYAGGGLPGAPVAWDLHAARTTFTPPNRDDFTFGIWDPWWGWRGWDSDDDTDRDAKSWHHEAVTDATGSHVLHVDFLSARPSVPMSVAAQAAVTDVNRQQWTSSLPLIVHPAAAYVGLRTRRPFVDQGQPISVEAIGVDLDGKAVPGMPIDIESVRLDWRRDKAKDRYVTEEKNRQTCHLKAAAEALVCKLSTDEGGTYRVTAFITDTQGRKNETQILVWVLGGKSPPARDVELEKVVLIPDKKEYAGGDTAVIMVQAPFAPAEGILSVRRSGLVLSERFTMASASTTLRVPIVDGYVPNVYVQVDLVGAAPRLDDAGQPAPQLPKRPAYARGDLDLSVPPRARTLAVSVKPREAKLAPGGSTKLDIAVKDAKGAPVTGAEVAIIAVDEAILALSGYQFPSPVDVFYSGRPSGVRDYDSRSRVKLAKPELAQLAEKRTEMMMESAAAPAQKMDFGGGGPSTKAPPGARALRAPMKEAERKRKGAATEEPAETGAIALRTNFNPLAAFVPAVITGADGSAVVDLKLPDNLTRYRVVAIAVAGEHDFGKGESAVTARMPLMVRPSPPRFLNFGDRLELPVVLQNQTDQPLDVAVAVRTTNLAITAGAGRRLTIPPNDRVEVRFPAAAEMAGTARLQVAAAAPGNISDAAELAWPVWTPATTEAFATYGVIDAGAIRQPVAMPGAVVKQFGGLEIETASTQLQALTDAVLYLVTYPFECSEQLSSRVLSIAALRDVLTAFQVPDMPKPAQLEERVRKDLERLFSMQNGDGGFPLWERGHESWPYLSVHVTNALVRAKAKGYEVPEPMLTRAHEYLRTIENRYPSYYPEEIRRVITSYALYVRMLMGDVDVPRAQGLLREAGGPKGLSLEAVGWLLGVMAQKKEAATERATLLRYLDNNTVETAGAANWTTHYSDGEYLILHSDRRVDGVILESIIAEKPQSDLIPKVVAGLLAHRTRGRWSNTQDNVFVLLALDRYFNTYEKVTPSFVARVWLGDRYAGEHPFKGRETDRFAIDIPMSVVADVGKADLTIQKDGAGRLYYRIGMRYAPADLTLAPADYGFAVDRRYEAVDRPDDVQRDADGTWKIKAGARVRVRLTMVAENRRYHVALVDPLPAGLEPMNPALAVTGDIPKDPKATSGGNRYWWWSRTWYEYQNMRDERVEAFASLLWAGVHEYTYVARATTPGTFVVPPPKAEEMYFPETFGRGQSDRVVVTP